MSKHKGKHLKQKDPATTSKRVVWFILFNAIAWIWCSYLLAYLQRVEIAEELSKVALTTIVATVLGYYGKSLVENISKNNVWPDKKDTVCCEDTTPKQEDSKPIDCDPIL